MSAPSPNRNTTGACVFPSLQSPRPLVAASATTVTDSSFGAHISMHSPTRHDNWQTMPSPHYSDRGALASEDGQPSAVAATARVPAMTELLIGTGATSTALRTGGRGPAEGRIARPGRGRGGPRGTAQSHGGRMAGHKNYTAPELDRLLDIVEEIEPIGANMWASVGEEYAKWATEKEYNQRDSAILKQNFDRLSNVNKRTGDPTCPPKVRRAKRIARAILGRAQSVTLGCASSSDDEPNTTCAAGRIGARSDRRAPGAGGVRPVGTRASNDAALLACVTQVTDNFAAMSDAYIGRSSVRVEEVVRDEVRKAIAESMEELKSLLQSRDN
eukprot:IDg1334t1